MTRRGSPSTGTDQRATAAGTERFQRAVRRASSPTTSFGLLPAGSCASSIGIGTYLGECDDADDASYAVAIRAALERGINVIDSSINYRCQRSERTVGTRASRRDRRRRRAARRGNRLHERRLHPARFLGAADPRGVSRRTCNARSSIPGIVSADDVVGGGHALSPSFLDHQIKSSQANLGVRTLDVYYLHNPEQQLDSVQPARFRTILRRAFALLEERVAERRHRMLRMRDVEWTAHAAGRRADILDLSELVGIARDVGGDDHHFRVVQLPVNLAMSEAVRAPTQRLGTRRVVPLLQATAELGDLGRRQCDTHAVATHDRIACRGA